jgi:uncharacterized protein
MSYGREFYQMMIKQSEAYARWDLETSTNILRSRKPMIRQCLSDSTIRGW